MSTATTTTTAVTNDANNNNSQPTLQDFNENAPLVLKYHSFVRSGEYLPKFETFTFIDYYILHLLRLPIAKELIRHYEENFRDPIIIRREDNTISVVKGDKKLASINEARATGSQYLLYPLKLQTRRFHNVSLNDIDSWQREIMQERQSFEDLRNPIPIYQDTPITIPGYNGAQLPLIEEWIGAISSSDWDGRNQCVRLILERTNELSNLHEHISTNKAMYSLGNNDQLRRNADDIYMHRDCSRWWCTGCYQRISLPSLGIFYAGEKLPNDDIFVIPINRQKAESLREILDMVQILNISNVITSMSDATTAEEIAELSKVLALLELEQ